MTTWPTSVTTPRQIPFQELLENVYVALRIDKRAGPSGAEVLDRVIDAINGAYRYAWNAVAWPESKVWESWPVEGHPTVVDAAGDPAPFVPRTYLLKQVATLYGVWNKHPLADDTALELTARQGPDGWYLKPFTGQTLTSVWLNYRPDPWKFSAELWQSGVTYSQGDVKWFKQTPGGPGDGHCYAFIGAIPASTVPATGGVVDANWQQRPVLYVLQRMVQAGATAMYKADDEKFFSADVLRTSMEVLIEDECMRLNQQDGLRTQYHR